MLGANSFLLLSRQSRQHRLLPQHFSQRPRRSAPVHCPRLQSIVRHRCTAEDSSLPAQNHARPNVYMIADAHLPREHRALPNRARARRSPSAQPESRPRRCRSCAPHAPGYRTFAPRRMRVSPSAPRSTVEFAPISTSSSITSVPCCGNCVYAPVAESRTYPNPSAPSTTPA